MNLRTPSRRHAIRAALVGPVAILASVTHAADGDARWVATIEAQRLAAHVAALPEQRSVRGDDAHRDGLARTEQLLLEHLRERGFEPKTQEIIWRSRTRTSTEPEVTTQNIWIDLPGSERPGEVIIVAAHFDTVPNSPGADDNGSGVAALLELAEVLRDRPRLRTVRLMLFTAEEFGLVGARRYAEWWMQESGEACVGMMSLDMIGYFSDEPGSQQWPIAGFPGVEFPDRGNFICLVASTQQRPFSTVVAQAMQQAVPEMPVFNSDFLPMMLPDMLRSDHAPFIERGIPAIHVTDTSNFRYIHYHQPTDTADRLDYRRLAQVTQQLASAIDHLATRDLPWQPVPSIPLAAGGADTEAADAPVEVGR